MEVSKVDSDSQAALEGYVWENLELSVTEGWRTQFDAEQLYYNWFAHRHSQPASYWEGEHEIIDIRDEAS